ncbi:MAG: M36 family metallopeptidase, partial [Acidobacteriota bacterium]
MLRSILFAALCAAFTAAAFAAPISFLTGPNPGEPQQVALDYLAANHADFGLTADDVSDYIVTDAYRSEHNGVTHVYLVQRHAGIEVYAGMVNINVARDGSIISLGNRFVANIAGTSNLASPAITAERALESAARHLGIAADLPPVLEYEGGPALGQRFAADGFSRSEISAGLVWEPAGNGARLAWKIQIDMLSSADMWDLRVDAATGDVLAKTNRTQYAGGHEHTHDTSTGGIDFQYRAIPLPFESPEEPGSSHSIVTNPHDATASPFGWHDTDGDIDPDFTDTRGNNVFAQDDTDGNNAGGFRPGGGAGPGLTFDFAFDDVNDEPWEGTNFEAAIVNLFYWNNISHDWLYYYGFDEVSGNFQENNYGNGGLGSDAVFADAQDNVDNFSSNNANFGTPSDGQNPRMQMFVFRAPALLSVASPGSVAGDYTAGAASFGGFLTQAGLPGTPDFELVSDGTAAPSEGCNTLVGFTAGRVAVIDRGGCEFGTKILNAENAGAIGAVVINNQGDDVIAM